MVRHLVGRVPAERDGYFLSAAASRVKQQECLTAAFHPPSDSFAIQDVNCRSVAFFAFGRQFLLDGAPHSRFTS